MAMAEEVRSKSTVEVLKPFYERATAAEERLAQLEDRLAQLETLHGIKKGDSTNECKEVSSVAKEFQAKLEVAHAELISEREKASKEIQKLVEENLKLRYRISHLLRAVKEADLKLNAP